MTDRIEGSRNTATERSIHVVLVPKHLRERVEEYVRQIVDDEDDVSGYMLSGLATHSRLTDDELKKCADKVMFWSHGNTVLKCFG